MVTVSLSLGFVFLHSCCASFALTLTLILTLPLALTLTLTLTLIAVEAFGGNPAPVRGDLTLSTSPSRAECNAERNAHVTRTMRNHPCSTVQ